MPVSTRQFTTRLIHPSSAGNQSIPIIIPDDMKYNPINNTLVPTGEKKGRSKLKAVPESMKLLKELEDKPLAVLAIAGPYRTGKSYILSRLLGSTDAFDLGHTMNAKTFGIWMGTTILECDDYYIILLDTEGIDAVTATGTEDARILVITLLISSYFIYNSTGVPNKSDLEKMKVFTTLAKSIAIQDGKKANQHELREYFPKFLWLLRDVILDTVDEDGKQISPSEFLKKRVLVRGDEFEETMQDKVGRAIHAFFFSVECKTLPPPSAVKEVMNNIEKCTDMLEPKFNEGVEQVIAYLKQEIGVKKILNTGQPADGPMFSSLVEELVVALSDPSAVPVLDNTWMNVISLRVKQLQERLVAEYKKQMMDKIANACQGKPLEEDESPAEEGQSLMDIHRETFSAVNGTLIKELGRFLAPGMSESLTQQSVSDEFEKYLIECETQTITYDEGKPAQKQKVVGGALLVFIQENHKKSSIYCSSLFDCLYTPIKERASGSSSNPSYTFESLLSDLESLHNDYLKQAIGPAKWEVFEEKKQKCETDKQFFKQLAGYNKKLMKAAEDAEQTRRQNEQLHSQITAIQHQMEEDAKVQEQKLEKLHKQHEEAMERMREEERRRVELDSLKHTELLQANYDMMAQMTKSHAEAQREQREQRFFDMMERQNLEHARQIEKLTENLKQPPPLPPPPPPEKKGGCSIM